MEQTYDNTSQLNSFLMSLKLQLLARPNYMDIFPNDAGHTMLKKAVRHFQQGEYNEAHATW